MGAFFYVDRMCDRMPLEMPCVTTKRLYVRPLEVEDVSDLFEVYQDPRVVMGNAGIKPITSINGMLKYLQYGSLSYVSWKLPQAMVLERLEDGKVIGIIDYHTCKEGVGELGYMLNYAYWNQGYMREAIQVMVYLGFVYLQLRRIEARYDPQNIGSEKILQYTGFQKEGYLRKALLLNDDKYHDLVICSILKEEFDETQIVFDKIEYPNQKEIGK